MLSGVSCEDDKLPIEETARCTQHLRRSTALIGWVMYVEVTPGHQGCVKERFSERRKVPAQLHHSSIGSTGVGPRVK
ncbi:hypothetical protein NHX12_005211 [Muraenolepis orangiensis]|uniref:Uncharacterized protein n=1 Tax=Muraenolepis orangiensis TaxID=630683 RepID=A0A9Q0ICR5_9TELE|nr:hypothetical protein NHX12_005211 [Muraenolepis orangiensis]